MTVTQRTVLAEWSSQDICAYLEDQLTEGVRYQVIDRYAYLALAELASRLTPAPAEDDRMGDRLPVVVTEALRDALGAKSRSFKPSYKRALFALKVWDGKYGPFTPEQGHYAHQLLLHAIRRGVANYHRAKAAGSKTGVQGYVNAQLDRIVHHENTHAGFQRRAAQTIDITETLKETLK